MVEHVSFEGFRDDDTRGCSLGSVLVFRQVNVGKSGTGSSSYMWMD